MQDSHRSTAGLGWLASVILLWVLSGALSQRIYDTSFNHPFFLTFLSTMTYSLFSLGFLWFPSWRRKFSADAWEDFKDRRLRKCKEAPIEAEISKLLAEEDDSPVIRQTKQNGFDVLLSALCLAPIWVSSTYLYNVSLSYTSLTSATIMASTCSLFTLIIGSALGTDTMTVGNILSVVVNLIGVSLISWTDAVSADSSDSTVALPVIGVDVTHSVFGDGLGLLSACLYAGYTVLFKRRLDEDNVDMGMFFAFVGLVTSLLFWPVFLILDSTHVEPFLFPDHNSLMLILLNAFCGCLLPVYMWGRAVSLLQPLTVSLGMSLTIPCSLLFELILTDTKFTQWHLCGTFLVFLSFFFAIPALSGTSLHAPGSAGGLDGAGGGTPKHPSDHDTCAGRVASLRHRFRSLFFSQSSPSSSTSSFPSPHTASRTNPAIP
eukprot:TRINITY_DN2875_c1_g4::TRINITY_DN2875_c1_g4_i1::g.6054::m.6054 TRINITY_DN2875_c1_g4::TRINITY_DN2875_c1_g4_i1::g.6054  ORF type:complete len:432 (-),score=61.81,sp/Q03730/YMB8_YEAST/29.37/2e-36,EamA/PF00892.15/50,EamA/PF00892.15/0.0017,EamA/PF00892.15/1.7e-06,UAA/PF08449.6/73,UAA/PF08449.6/3.9e-08,EmrE/PF13536.1/8.5e+02,EmrE/PF13536.1/0.00021,EmrE/PF13536.1/34,TPT/PF03151.11/1.1,TPT/PF03151.11/0.032,P5-ATPase/PF12409.3/0.064,P5-ATPase/PF12409.3/6.3e+03,UPF0546/PF10639.4/0.12,UPF0546/PF10639.4/84,D